MTEHVVVTDWPTDIGDFEVVTDTAAPDLWWKCWESDCPHGCEECP